MNADNLKDFIGAELTYKEICSLLSQPEKGRGDSRNSQFKEWGRYFNFYKPNTKGHKYVITELYDTPKEKIDGRKNNGGHIINTKYGTLMDKLILNWLNNYPDQGCVVFTFYELFGIFDILEDRIPMFTGECEKIMAYGYEEYAVQRKLDKKLVQAYFEKLRNIVVGCLETALDRMQKNEQIEWIKYYKVKDENSNLKLPDNELVDKIKEAEQIVYNDMGILHFSRINPKINKQFKEKVRRRVGIINYWRIYIIRMLNEEAIIEHAAINTVCLLNDLMERLIQSIFKALMKMSYKVDDKRFYPFRSTKNIYGIIKLDILVWELLTVNYIEPSRKKIRELVEVTEITDYEFVESRTRLSDQFKSYTIN